MGLGWDVICKLSLSATLTPDLVRCALINHLTWNTVITLGRDVLCTVSLSATLTPDLVRCALIDHLTWNTVAALTLGRDVIVFPF